MLKAMELLSSFVDMECQSLLDYGHRFGKKEILKPFKTGCSAAKPPRGKMWRHRLASAEGDGKFVCGTA